VYDAGFVNGLALSGGALDRSAGSDVERRLGYFSDLYYDRQRNEWWGLSDRGPGGGTLSYETRVQRFTLDVAANGAIGNFQVAQTIKFTRSGVPLNGLAPNPSDVLGNAFDPEGFVINPKNGNLLVSDEYGPSLYEFDRNGQLVREYTMAPNLVPKVGATPNYDAKPPTLTSGREPNRGLEGLAISPDGKYAYAVLQNGAVQDGWSSSSRGRYTRIVKFDTATGQAVGQYAYKLDSASQGRGISALVALGNDRFMILERNNRGIGVGATLASPDKNVFMIDLNGATDVSGIDLPASGDLPFGFTAVAKGAKVIDLDADTLAALGGKSPEKWEGLAVGPQLANGSFLVLAGSDNDYSVTQSDGGEQFDVWFRMSDADPYATSIQCPIGAVVGCTGALTDDYVLLPGVLHAYTANIDGYVAAVPEPETLALMLAGLIAVGGVAHRNLRTA
ncbi:MAG: esterase-like activity of phytase family protein, partial [Burkholderiales bacterium]|nr:esterase-like activity of phytase family protein [Burkholderiales bacterium]